MMIVASIGIFVDGYLSFIGLFAFANDALVPFWLIVLWFGFSITLQRGLKFLNKHWIFAALLGSFGGSTSYLSGYYLGAVDFGFSFKTSLIILVLHWLVLMPVFMNISRYFFSKRLCYVEESL